MRTLIADMRVQWEELDRRIRAFDVEFAAFLPETQTRDFWRRSPASAR